MTNELEFLKLQLRLCLQDYDIIRSNYIETGNPKYLEEGDKLRKEHLDLLTRIDMEEEEEEK